MASRKNWYRRVGTKEHGFHYEDAAGKRIKDAATLARIKSLVIPPAWVNVLIAPRESAKIQVVGHDTIGRLQYLYHESFRERQQRKKFSKLLAFAEKLPFLRRQAKLDLKQKELTKDRVLALIIQLIDKLSFRVGSEQSVEQYKTFGITTLRSKHVQIDPDGTITFDFVGKHHIHHKISIKDKRLANILYDLKSLRGAKLFKYVTEEGKIRSVTGRDVNDYIKQATDPSFTAKDFRTWGASVKAAVQLARIGITKGERSIKKNIVSAVKAVAEKLGNTVAVARNSYIHPKVLKKYEKGVTLEKFEEEAAQIAKESGPNLHKDEAEVIALLKS
jgi:DNA topoisomerase I